MMYYILWPDDTADDVIYDDRQLGEVSFKTFWSATGYKRLIDTITSYSDEPDALKELLGMCQIIDQTGKHYEIQEFLDKIDKLYIRQ